MGKPCRNPRRFSAQFRMISQAFSLARSKQVMGVAWTKASVAEMRCSTTSMSCSGDTEPAFNMATISWASGDKVDAGLLLEVHGTTWCGILQPKNLRKGSLLRRTERSGINSPGKSFSNPLGCCYFLSPWPQASASCPWLPYQLDAANRSELSRSKRLWAAGAHGWTRSGIAAILHDEAGMAESNSL